MSAGFTPGPWGYSFDKRDTGFEGDAFMAGPLHCDVTGGFSSVIEGGLVMADDNENEANARLIAAAPELYEALERIVSDRGDYGEDSNLAPADEQDRDIGIAMRALAKARGEP